MRNFGYVLATKMLVEKKLPVRFMYRENGTEGDSGWRFFAGMEDQEYVDNPDNIVICDIETILSFDQSIKPFLNSICNSAYERADSAKEFELVRDYDFGANLD